MSALDLAGYLQKRLKELGLTTVAAAERSGLSRQTWHKLMRAEIDEIKLSTLVRVANTLETHVLSMLELYFHGKSLTPASVVPGAKKFATGFVDDVTFPDNETVYTGQVFQKVWEIVNLGTEPWIGWQLQCIDDHLRISINPESAIYQPPATEYGLKPLRNRVPIPDTLPGEHVRLRVGFRAPDLPCTVISYWKSVDRHGTIVFPELTGLYCLVRVVAP